MPALEPEQRRAQARYAIAVRNDLPDRDARARDLAAIKLQNYIRRTVDAAPPLTPEQRSRLALLLRGDAA